MERLTLPPGGAAAVDEYLSTGGEAASGGARRPVRSLRGRSAGGVGRGPALGGSRGSPRNPVPGLVEVAYLIAGFLFLVL